MTSAKGSSVNTFDKWLKNAMDPTKEPVTFYKPLSDYRLKELEIVRNLNVELAEKRIADEKAQASLIEQQNNEDSTNNEDEEGDDEVIPLAIETSIVSKPRAKSKAMFLPAKMAGADESLFTGYA